MKLQDAIADLLEQVHEEYSNHGCNDFSLPNTPEARKFVEEMYKAGGEDDPEIDYNDDGTISTSDWMVLSRISELIRENGLPAAKEQ